MDINDLIATLPDPEKDELPPYVGIKPEHVTQAKATQAFMDSLMHPKNTTEERVKYALKSVFGINLSKVGDYRTIFGGRQVWVKHVADFEGSTPVRDGVNWHTYCEVKGISPGNNFNFARLDKTDAQTTQFDRLNAAHLAGDFVLLALGWWIARYGAKPVKVKQKSREITRWNKEDVYLEIDLLQWDQFLKLYEGRRSLKPKDRELFPPCTIFKSGNRWRASYGHWLHVYVGMSTTTSTSTSESSSTSTSTSGSPGKHNPLLADRMVDAGHNV